jgi:flagellar secretion chaperone FliS
MNIYFEQKILSADPIELTQLVYDRAILCVREAREHLAKRRILERSTAIGRAYAAIAELHGSLRPEAAPVMVERLEGLYLYMQRLLIEANSDQTDGPLAEALGLLMTLAEAWHGLKRENEHRRETHTPTPGSADWESMALTA